MRRLNDSAPNQHDRFTRPPKTPNEANHFVMRLKDHALKGISDNQVVSLSKTAGMEVVDDTDERFIRGETIVRVKNMQDPDKIAYYRWTMPSTPEAYDRLIRFFQARIDLEKAKLDITQDSELLEIGDLLPPENETIKQLYLAKVKAEDDLRQAQIKADETRRIEADIRKKRLAFLKSSRGYLERRLKSEEIIAYEAKLDTTPNDELARLVSDRLKQVVHFISEPAIIPFPQTGAGSLQNEHETVATYRLLNLLTNLPETDATDSELEDIFRKRIFEDLSLQGYDGLRVQAKQFVASHTNQSPDSDRFSSLMHSNEQLRHDVIEEMLEQQGIVHTINDLNNIVEFLQAVAQRDLFTPEGYSERIISMLEHNLLLLSTSRFSDTQASFAADMGRFAAETLLSYIRRKDSMTAAQIMQAVSVNNGDDIGGLRAIANRHCYSAFTYGLLNLDLQGKIPEEMNLGISQDILALMNDSFVNPDTISNLWRLQDTLVSQDRKLALLPRYIDQVVTRWALGGEALHLDTHQNYKDIFKSDQVPQEVKAKLLERIQIIAVQPDLLADEKQKVQDILASILKS